MPAEQLKAFLRQAKQDTALQNKLKNSANLETTLAIAKDAGFNISANDVTEMQAELEDNELKNASGGRGFAEWFEGFFRCTTTMASRTATYKEVSPITINPNLEVENRFTSVPITQPATDRTWNRHSAATASCDGRSRCIHRDHVSDATGDRRLTKTLSK
ncbi:Nif11-like leader peptide family natural product precursor [Synechococcus sp. NOUM97013]|uniref:Nif11-like leader peptide family natural product precursor n=1 Tax=Synechococcus sp. NOUM97013 TaxID=1442555 RepID=UPI001648FFF3|nr:Nif11-like leader peptide family natural product precursor [Synechococcus sp. NOUM97013]QNI74886.1 nif11-like leader peptide domain protein [Synechococcus sp. NOUM97013]